MIDKDLFDQLEPHEQELAKAGFQQLVSSGILNLQKKRLQEQVLAGPMDESPDVTAKKIQDYRRHLTAILSLEELTKSISK